MRGHFLVALALVLVGCVSAEVNCQKGLYNPNSPTRVPFQTLNLDTAPQDRWTAIVTPMGSKIKNILTWLLNNVPKSFQPELEKVMAQDLNSLVDELGEYGQEMKGISQTVGMETGEIVLLNIFYEIFTFCTSIVVEDRAGNIMHGRNLDFGLGPFNDTNLFNFTWQMTPLLRDLIVNVNYTRNGEQLFMATHYAGYVGVLTGMRPNGFSVTIDDRFAGRGGWFGILKWILGDHTESWVSLLVRDVLTGQSTYQGAVDLLSSTPIIATVYYIVGGAKSGEGTVLSRSLTETLHPRSLNTGNSTWWVLETNYDWWEKVPFFDQRRPAAIKCVNQMGQDAISFPNMFDILSTKPVLNDLTTYSVLMSASTGQYEVYKQTCQAPCPLW